MSLPDFKVTPCHFTILVLFQKKILTCPHKRGEGDLN
jgi:hypothetical protein